MRSAAALIETLQRNGIFKIFGLPGSTEAPLLDALLDYPETHYVLGLHESVVVGMADGYARATGHPSVVNLHTTVGLGNGLTGLFNAWKDGTPILAIATHKHSRILGRDAFCVGPNLVEWASPVTKWGWEGLHADQIPEEVARAVKIAGSIPTSPVFLSYPEDLLGEEIAWAPDPGEISQIIDSGWPSPEQVEVIAQMLSVAQRPVCIAGDEISRTGCADTLMNFAELWDIPVLQESRRSSISWNVPSNHRYFAGEYISSHPLVQSADVILALGPRLSMEFSPVRIPDVPPTARLIHVHRNSFEVGKLYPPAIGLVANVAPLLNALCESADRYKEVRKLHSWPREGFQYKKMPPEVSLGSCTAHGLAAALARIAPSDTVIVDESIRSSPALLARYPLRPGNYFHTSGGGLGWGLPAALGIQMAWPKRPVMAYVGDGSLMFSIQALWTAVRENLPIKVVVPNNRKFLAVKAGLIAYQGNAVKSSNFLAVDLTHPTLDLVSLASGFGVPGQSVSDPDKLEPALKWAFTHPGPALVDVRIDEDLGD